MRLTGLTLTNYGNFKSERIDFSPRPGTLNVLMAPNGGGKSVLRSAFCDLLFGIGGQSPMGFRFGYPGMRIMADAVTADGAPFSFGRRKGQGNTLIDLDGNALDPATIARSLGAVDRKRLEQLFALDTERLRAGQEDLLASGGEFAAALVSGAGGARDLRALRRKLEEARDALAPPRRSANRPFYQALDGFVTARKRKEAGLLRPDKWKKMQQALDEARQHQAAQNTVAQAASAGIARLERVRRVRPILAAIQVATDWLDAHPDAPNLDGQLKTRLDEGRAQIVIVDQRLRREQDAAAQVAEQLAAVIVDEPVLTEAEAIERLVQEAGAARKARADLPDVASRLESRRVAVADGLRELGSALPVERAGETLPGRALVNRARRLSKAWAARQEAMQTAAAEITRLTGERNQVRGDHAALDAPADVSALDAVVKEIQRDGDPVKQSHEKVARHQQAAADLATALARASGWTGSADDLVRLAVLSPDSYQRHDDALRAARSEAENRRRDVEQGRQALDEARRSLDRIAAGGAVPDAAALADARQRRDQGWHLIYRRAFTPDPPAPAEEQAFTGGASIPLAYQQAVITADTVADRRMQDAETIARVDAAQASLQDAQARLQAADVEHQQAIEAQRAAETAWSEACHVLPLGPAPALKEVQAFLTARDKVVDAQRVLTLANADQSALEQTQARWAARLEALMATDGSLGLSDLLALADARLTAAQAAQAARAALRGKLEATEKSLTQAEAKQTQAKAALAEWQTEWQAVLADLGRPPDENPAITDDILAVLEELALAFKDHTELTDRVAGMQRDVARFAAEATGLAERVAADLDRGDPFALVSALQRRLQTAKDAASQRMFLTEQAQDAAKKAALAQQQLVDRQDELRAVLTLVGATTFEDADHRLHLAAERANHAAALAEAQARLADAGDLLPADTLRTEAAAVPPDDTQRLIQEAEQRRQAAQLAAQEAAATVAELTQRMNTEQDATEAVDAAADQQAAVATMGRVLEEALLYHLAAEMLDKALAAVEQDSEPKMLQRITALFAALTGGTYARVVTEPDDAGVARLSLVQRDFPDERQAVNDLSEGTRDQLYLALRLAAIEFHTASAPPLPFIGDDILQTFDDDRALAALRVLQDISQTVQVILLTHHRHVLDLARRLPDLAVHICRVGATLEPA